MQSHSLHACRATEDIDAGQARITHCTASTLKGGLT